MVANPIQKRQRNSMLGGLLIGLVVGLLICAVFYVLLIRPNMSQVGTTASTSGGQALVLRTAVKAGNPITTEMLEVARVGAVPADAVGGIEANTVAKIDLQAGTVLSASMLLKQGEDTNTRAIEYNMLALPTQLSTGDYIDVRLQMPDGTDYIVVSKKQVQNANDSTIWLKMNEEETLVMSNAIVEYYIMSGSKLYATKYTEPGIQTASKVTYTPNRAVATLVQNAIGAEGIANDVRFTEALNNMRNSNINAQLSRYSDKGLENLEEKIQEEIQNLKQSRQAYFGVLDSASTSTTETAE